MAQLENAESAIRCRLQESRKEWAAAVETFRQTREYVKLLEEQSKLLEQDVHWVAGFRNEVDEIFGLSNYFHGGHHDQYNAEESRIKVAASDKVTPRNSASTDPKELSKITQFQSRRHQASGFKRVRSVSPSNAEVDYDRSFARHKTSKLFTIINRHSERKSTSNESANLKASSAAIVFPAALNGSKALSVKHAIVRKNQSAVQTRQFFTTKNQKKTKLPCVTFNSGNLSYCQIQPCGQPHECYFCGGPHPIVDCIVYPNDNKKRLLCAEHNLGLVSSKKWNGQTKGLLTVF
jgi:nitrate reductase assembly molybdenum cofactor insertion protein NarJ